MSLGELKTFVPWTVEEGTDKPYMSFSPSGKITIYAVLAANMQIDEGDKVALHLDEKTGKWYISFVDEGFEVRQRAGSTSFGFCSRPMVRRLLTALKVKHEGRRVEFDVAEDCVTVDGVAYWELLTDRPTITGKKEEE